MVLKRARGAIARRRQGLSLRTILVVPFVLQLCLAVGMTSWLSWRNGQRLIQDSAFALQAETGQRIQLKLAQLLEAPLLISRLNGDLVQSGQLSLANLDGSEAYLLRQLRQFDSVSGIWLANGQGELRAVNRQAAVGFNLLRADLASRPGDRAASPPPQPGAIAAPESVAPESVAPESVAPESVAPESASNGGSLPSPLLQVIESPEAVRQAPWYRSALEAEALVWSPVFPGNGRTGNWLHPGSAVSTELYLNASLPLYNPQTGALEGVVSSGIALSLLSQFLSELGISQTGSVFVVDAAGLLVAASDRNQPLVRSPLPADPDFRWGQRLSASQGNDPLMGALAASLERVNQAPSQENSLRQFVLTPTAPSRTEMGSDDAPGDGPGAGRFGPRRDAQLPRHRHFVSVIPFELGLGASNGAQVPPGLNWRIVLVMPERAFTSQIRRTTRTTLALSGVALLGAIALGGLTADWLARPILRLSRASQAIARGDLDQTLEEHGPIREVATVARSFNQMSQKLRRAFDHLETKVDRRTRLLHQSFEFEATLKRLTDRVRDSLNEDEILHRAVEELALALGVRGCNAAIYDLERRTSTVKYEYTTFPKRLQGGTLEMDNFAGYGQLLAGQYFQHCGTIAVPSRGRVAMLACPMRDDQGVLGDLWLIKPAAEGFDSQEIRLVQQVANQCAIAIRQARLYQAAQSQVTELARLNQLKDDFLSTVSHELRTPMANMKMAIQMLEIGRQRQAKAAGEDRVPEPGDRYFQILKDEYQRESRLIDNLLDLSRLDIQSAPPQLSTIEPRRWLRRVIQPYQVRSQERLRWQLFLPDYLPLLQTDARYLERILMELLDNACKYTPDGECITVSAQLEQSRLSFSVGNSGVEIPPQEQRRIFERFYRIPNSDPWKHGGTGLGLALVRQLTERLGGQVQVESSNHHSLFTVSFPLVLEA